MNTTEKFEDTVLILVDIQNDFVSGSLATDVDGEYTDRVAEWLQDNKGEYPFILTTQDWHVADDTEHIEQWGEHCMANTFGAKLNDKIVDALIGDGKKTGSFVRFYKGHYDHGYSGFEGILGGEDADDPENNGIITRFLREKGIKKVHIIGIATEHCVRATAIDAAKYGFETVVVSDLVNAVDPQAGENVLNTEFPENGVQVVQSDALVGGAENTNKGDVR